MLSTPPAFILSQDQTLMLKVDSRSGLLSLANYPKPSLLGFCSEFSQIQRSKPDLLFPEFSGFYILFNLQLSRFVVANFFKSNSDIISRFLLFVNNFFDIFSISKRETGFEPAAPTLARWCSTPEPLAHNQYTEIIQLNRGDRIRTCDLLVPNQAL